jgi:hypothetical protein
MVYRPAGRSVNENQPRSSVIVVRPGASGPVHVTRAFRTGVASAPALTTRPLMEPRAVAVRASRGCATAEGDSSNRTSNAAGAFAAFI